MNTDRQDALFAPDEALTHYLDSLMQVMPDPPLPAGEEGKGKMVDGMNCRAAIHDQTLRLPGRMHHPFQGLLFSVGGIVQAVPAEEIQCTLEWSAEITQMRVDSMLLIGSLFYQERAIKLIDTARLIMHGNEQAEFVQNSYPASRKILMIKGSPLGLVCDDVLDTITIEPEQVRWRMGNTKRPWYAGIIVERKCALLDIDILVHMFTRT